MYIKRLQLEERCEEASVWNHIYNNWVRFMELEDNYIMATLNLQQLTFSGHLGAVETRKQLFSSTSCLCSSLHTVCINLLQCMCPLCRHKCWATHPAEGSSESRVSDRKDHAVTGGGCDDVKKEAKVLKAFSHCGIQKHTHTHFYSEPTISIWAFYLPTSLNKNKRGVIMLLWWQIYCSIEITSYTGYKKNSSYNSSSFILKYHHYSQHLTKCILTLVKRRHSLRNTSSQSYRFFF